MFQLFDVDAFEIVVNFSIDEEGQISYSEPEMLY